MYCGRLRGWGPGEPAGRTGLSARSVRCARKAPRDRVASELFRGPLAFLVAECRELRARLQGSFDGQLATACRQNKAWLRGS